MKGSVSCRHTFLDSKLRCCDFLLLCTGGAFSVRIFLLLLFLKWDVSLVPVEILQ